MKDKSKKILELCESWVDSAYNENGGLSLGEKTEKYRLRNNGICFHNLSYKEIQSVCIGLTKVLLHKGLNTIIDYDHLYFWSWVAELISYSDLEYFSNEDREIKELFETTIRSSLAGARSPVANREEWEKQIKKDELVEFNTKQLVGKKNLITAYLVFPLLEGILKRRCCEYVSYSGRVKKNFSVPDGYGGVKKYVKSGRRKYCSSLRDLLFLFYNDIANSDLKSHLYVMRQHISKLSDKQDAFNLIYDWRNTSLHGESNFPTIGGTLLNIIVLIIIDEISDVYDDIQPKVLKKVQWEIKTTRKMNNRPPWIFYPPF